MAYHYKKEKSWKEAVDMFEPLVQTCEGDVAIEALVELAKIYEHRLKDVHQALLYTELALEKWNQFREMTKKTSKEALEKRLVRLKINQLKHRLQLIYFKMFRIIILLFLWMFYIVLFFSH
ncbi:hypothetical protein MUB16_28590 [Priestia sp. OVL9]|nr:hypothetical protein [Priestia sp. OVL9]